MEPIDKVLAAFVAQGRMKLPGKAYVPCYKVYAYCDRTAKPCAPGCEGRWWYSKASRSGLTHAQLS